MPRVHVAGPHCPGCEKKLDEGHELLRHWFHVIKKFDEDAHISWVFRTKEDQELCNRIGTSKSIWTTSKHNNMVGGFPYALAMDLFKQVGNVYYASKHFYTHINKILIENGCKDLIWGGEWPRPDYPHWQLKSSSVENSSQRQEAISQSQ